MWQCYCWKPDLWHLFWEEYPTRIASFKMHVRGVRIDTNSRNRLKTWHKVLLWNKEESFDSEAGNIVWEPLSERSLGKMLNGFEVLLVTSKTMGAELKEHYALIFLIFYFLSPSEKSILIFISLLSLLLSSSYMFQWVFIDLSNNVF